MSGILVTRFNGWIVQFSENVVDYESSKIGTQQFVSLLSISSLPVEGISLLDLALHPSELSI
jgi:hypothetical protein